MSTTFTLEKLELLQGNFSQVHQGRKITGPKAVLIIRDSDQDLQPDIYPLNPKENFTDKDFIDFEVCVYEGWNDFIKTSPIQKVLEVTPDKVKFQTKTSIYELTKKESTINE